jgi:hypothetical protein
MQGGVGQKPEPLAALRPISNCNKRLVDNQYHHLDEIDMFLNNITAIIEDINSLVGRATHQKFTKQRLRYEHKRFTVPLDSYWCLSNDDTVAAYLEEPETKRLLPIVKTVPERRYKGFGVVWVSNFIDEPLVVPDTTCVYLSDEPNVVGQTINEVSMRYEE